MFGKCYLGDFLEKIRNEKSVSLSREIRSLIAGDPYVRNTLADGLINYSALARTLAPKVKQKLNREIKEESVIVAIKRYADEINGKSEKKDYLNILGKSSISMQEDICYALLKRDSDVLKELENLLNDTDWLQGEVRIIVDGPSRVVVVLKTPRMLSFVENLDDEMVDCSENNSLITMRQPHESRTTYGVIAEIASTLSKKGISIELISAPPDLHFVVSEKDAEEAYRTLRELIKQAKESMQERDK